MGEPRQVVGSVPAAAGAAFARVRRHPVAIVRAVAGWGKTTTTSALIGPALWHRVGPSEAEPEVFLRRLATSLGRGPIGGSGTGVEPLATAIADRGTPFVLDDAHHLLSRPDGAALLTELVMSLEGSVATLLLTRPVRLQDVAPELASAPQVAAGDLALDAATLLPLAAANGVDDAIVPRVLAATGGWPAPCVEVLRILGSLPAAAQPDALASLLGAAGPAGVLVADEVIGWTGVDLLERLAQLALLGPTDPGELADLVDAGRSVVGRQLADLITVGLAQRDPLRPDAIGALPVVERFFLEEQLSNCSAGSAVVDDLAEAGERKGAPELALRVATRAGAQRGARVIARVLTEHGEDLLRRGFASQVDAAARALDAEHRTEATDLVHGQALFVKGDWSGALRRFTTVAGPADRWSTEMALRIGLVHHFRGDLAEALEAYAAGPAEDDGSPEFTALASWRATAHWLRGELEPARDHVTAAMRAATVRGDDRSFALAHTVAALLAASDGDRRANEAHHRTALAAAQRAGDVMQQVRIHVNRGSHHLEHGQYERALAETDRAIDLGEHIGFVPPLAVGHCNRSEILLRTGALDQANHDAQTALTLFEQIGSRNVSYALRLVGDVRRERGDLVLARQAYERAIALAGSDGDRQGLVPALLGLARTLCGDDPEAARAHAEEAERLADSLYAATVRVVVGWIALAAGDRAEAAQAAKQARAEARVRLDEHVEVEATTLLALLSDDPVTALDEAARLWHNLDDPLWSARTQLGVANRSTDPRIRARVGELERTLGQMGCPVRGGAFIHQAVCGTDVRAPVAIRALGGFAVHHDGDPLPASAWGSRKARDLLKLLVVRAGRGSTREEIAHLLWPDLPYDEVANRLSVALSVVRGVLAVDEGTPAIVADGVSVRLDPDAVEIDVEVFARAATAGLRAARSGQDAEARTLLTAAAAAYTGDLLEDDVDLGWAEDRRAELRATYLAVVRALAAAEVEDPSMAAALLLRILERDPYDEAAYLQLCRVLVAAGQHGEARRHHRRYVRRMDELGLPATPLDALNDAGPGDPQRDRTAQRARSAPSPVPSQVDGEGAPR